MGVRDFADQAVGAESAEVVGHLPGGDGIGWQAAEVRGQAPQVTVGEPVGLESEGQHSGEQCVAALLTEA